MFELKDEQKQIQSLARELALGEILPGAQARDRSHEFPTAIVQQLAQMGFMGMFIPEQYGGAGLDVLSYVLALEQVSYADAGVGVIMSVNNSLASWPILRFGTEEQKQKYLCRSPAVKSSAATRSRSPAPDRTRAHRRRASRRTATTTC
jgi:alkylation response protein AidB-like acyl-CoA dehydrogenase